MSVVINYKKNITKSKFGNLIFFVDEKYSLSALKKYFTKSENEFINDILKSQNLSKKIISFDLSSKKKIFLISLNKNINSSQIENLGGQFFNYLKDLKKKDFQINSDVMPIKFNNTLGYFLHGLKLKSYTFDKYKTKKSKRNILINVNGLTIYAEEKLKNGTLKNLYLKKNENNENFQITIAKKGEFKSLENSQLLVLYDGQTINKVNNKITNFYFSKSDFNLNSLNTDIVKDDKIQETKTKNHIICLNKYFNKDLTFNSKQKNYISHNCSKDTLDNLFQELYKRFITPLYIPILILICLFLIIFPKENKLYKKSRYLIFGTGIFIIILSEIISRFVTDNLINNLNIFIIPICIFIILFILFRIFIKKNIGAKT